MSADAVELLEQQAEAWNERAWDRMAALYGPETQMIGPPGWPEGGTYRGWDAIERQYRRLREPWSSDSVEIRELADRGDRAAGHFLWRCRGHDSGLVLEEEMSVAVWVAGRRFSELRYLRGFDAALAALED